LPRRVSAVWTFREDSEGQTTGVCWRVSTGPPTPRPENIAQGLPFVPEAPITEVTGVENSRSGNGQTVRPSEVMATEMNTNSCPASNIRPEEMNQKAGSSFRVSGISAEVLDEFRQLSDDELQQRNVRRYIADQKPGYPCRVSLVDAEIGESLLLLNFGHLTSSTPYRSIGPIFVRESARETYVGIDEIPEVLRARGRLLSVRAYDSNDMLAGAVVIGTAEIDQSIQEFFADWQVAYLHVHYAGPGCFACRVDRV
jgi:hypothetical protein